MIKSIFLLASFLFSISIYSQDLPKIVIIDNDTCIVFSIEQSKQLIIWDLERLECKEILELCEKVISECDSLITIKNNQIINYSAKDSLSNGIIKNYEELGKICDIEKLDLNQQLKFQKRKGFKNVVLSALSAFVATFIVFSYITK